jgi:hypothetical protein
VGEMRGSGQRIPADRACSGLKRLSHNPLIKSRNLQLSRRFGVYWRMPFLHVRSVATSRAAVLRDLTPEGCGGRRIGVSALT